MIKTARHTPWRYSVFTIAGTILALLLIPSPINQSEKAWSAQGDFSPYRSGITIESHPKGLEYNEFNLFTDNTSLCFVRYWSDDDKDTNCNADYQDERDFVTARNRSKSDQKFYHTLNAVKPGDTIRVMIYYHNNAQLTEENKYKAENVSVDIDYQNPENIQGHIACTNCATKNIYDLVTLDSDSELELEFQSDSIQIISIDLAGEGNILKLKDSDSRLTFSDTKIIFSDEDVPGCKPHDRYIFFDFTVKEKAPPAECKSLLMSPATIDIADILDQGGKEQMSITTNPAKFEGPYDWTASSGGKLTDSCSWTSWPTNTADEKMTFCGDNVGEKVNVKNRDFSACTDSTTITDYCGNGYPYTTGGEECDDGNSSNSDQCTTKCDLTYCGDKIVQNPNGNGEKEECDGGDGCSSTCKKETIPECESLLLSPATIDIADILDQGGKEQMSITTNPSKFEGPYDWTASSGGKLTDSCSWTSWPTNTSDEKMTFCGDNVGEKVSVKNHDFSACTDSTTITDYCGNGYPYTTGGEECDDGNSSNSDQCTTSCQPTSCGDGIIQTPNGEGKDGPNDDGNEACDDGNAIDTDSCTNTCEIPVTATFCGDGTVQNPNGNGQKEECDDGNTTNNDGCSSTCIKEIPTTDCDSLQFLNTEIIANTQTTLSVNVEPDSYVPDMKWIATETGTFNDKNPYNSGSETSVTFKNGSIDEYILAYDTDFPTACNDTLQVIGCKNLTATPSKFDLIPGKAQLITITPNPTSWNKSFKWTSSDTSATFNGQTSGYTSTDYTVDYIGNTNADITITDTYGNCKASAMATAIFCGNGIKETGETCDDGNSSNADTCTTSCDLTYCGDKTVQNPNGEEKDGPNDDGNEACDDGNTIDTDSCKNNCTIPTSEPIACTGLTSNPTSLSAGQASDISIAPQPTNFTGTFIWTASRGLLKNLSDPTGTEASTINTDENDIVNYNGDSVSSDTISIREQSNQCSAAMPITGPSGENPYCGNGIIETGETCEPPNTPNCDANCQIPGDGKPPGGGTPCEINILNKEGVELYDKFNVPTPVNISEFPFYFQIEEISSGKPYNLKTINNSGEYVGTFTSYSGTDWDSTDIYRPNENPMDGSYQTFYSFSMDKSQIDADTRLTVNSQFDSCSAQLKFSVGGPGGEGNPEETCTSMTTSIDTINFGMMNIKDQLPIIVELITTPQSVSDTFTWTVTNDLPLTFNGSESGYSNNDKTVIIDLAAGKTVNDVTQGTISIKSASAEAVCFANIDVKPAVSESKGDDSLVKKSFCIDEGTNIGYNGDPTTYNMFYYFEPEGRDAKVVFTDTFGDNGGRIYGNSTSDYILYDRMEIPTLRKGSDGSINNIPSCTTNPSDLCYSGDLGYNKLTLNNINDGNIDHQNDFIQLTFTGEIHADNLTCDNLELFRNQLTSQAYDTSGTETSSHDSYASIWATCSSYLLTRNMGDVFFEEPFDWGVDVSTISGVKNSTGLVFKKYEIGGTNFIDRFSSYIREFSTFIASLWEGELPPTTVYKSEKEEPITNRIQKNIAKITRYFEQIGSTDKTIDSLNRGILDTNPIFSEKPNKEQKIYEYHGNLTIESSTGNDIEMNDTEAITILVYGNLIINSNIKYATTAGSETLYKNIPSIAFVVKKDPEKENSGNILVSKNVEYISGVFYAENSFDSSDGNSENMLEIQGSVYGDIEPLFRTRKKIGDPEKDEGSIVIRYDERIILNTPPGLKDMLESNWEEVAR